MKQRFEMRVVLRPTFQLRLDKNTLGKSPEELAIIYSERMRRVIEKHMEAMIFDIEVQESQGEWGKKI